MNLMKVCYNHSILQKIPEICSTFADWKLSEKHCHMQMVHNI